MKKTLFLSALALISITAANAAAPNDNHFRVIITNHGFEFQLGDFHNWRYDRRDRCYRDGDDRYHSRRDYERLLEQERREREDWEREHRDWREHDRGLHRGWYKHSDRDRERDDRDRRDRDNRDSRDSRDRRDDRDGERHRG